MQNRLNPCGSAKRRLRVSVLQRNDAGRSEEHNVIPYGEWSADLLVITANPKGFKLGQDLGCPWVRVASVTSYGKLSRGGRSVR